ncbi:TPA: bacteriocin immunity protein [Salmonella enterica subsp. enterica serovar Enteritidis]|uniref:bacteriocin immunity protein n=1 Tax=Salmonella enterica TaxID=28901 RepID=UPI0002A69828|nr:bacteriocin immunity protein [Salmonella enterica]ECF1703882.1 bacteriocin immunity protein [Salmonella enterica subsp. enterica]ELO80833.1 bacteriocin immunity protein [Salmonella enterica subsp. enterica serovar Enteritidis str. SARB17]EDP9826667.1 bacteriocin immunity protein [Salmonella enterica subsp. enterica]EHM3444001.1 bacteriocin immunity protein [Salmonella enterica subsp. enterica]EHW9183274.1 bacteriocin immunity protein [Salmonella enterica subsp. enterica]
MKLKNKLEDYTEDEFIEFLNNFFEPPEYLDGDELSRYIDNLQRHFTKVTQHPDGSDLIFYPSEDREDSPYGIVEELKRWRISQRLPSFKDSK